MFILVASASAQPPIPIPPLPPILSNLTITPPEIERGDNVTIGLDIENIDSQPFTYIVTMKIGELTLLVDVELGAYESKTVSRTITPDAVGEYNVTVDGMMGSFEVVPAVVPLKPAEFVVTGLMFSEPEVEVGEENTITVVIENVGELSGNYTVIVRLESGPIVIVDEAEVTLEGGKAKMVPFTFTLDVEGTYKVETDGLEISFEVVSAVIPPRPAEFEFSNLRIFYPGVTPPEVERGQTVKVTVSIEAENVGELEGGRTVELKVDGEVVDSKEVTLGGGASATVLFELTRGEGTHEVEVEGFTESFTVNPKPSLWDKIPGFPYESIILGLIAAIIILCRARKC